jgi:hypothetical protein
MAKKAMKARAKKRGVKVFPPYKATAAATRPSMKKLLQRHLKKTGGVMTNGNKVISTPRELIAAMGGPKAAEEALGGRVHRDAISMWGTSNRVPYIHQYKVDRWARLNGWLIHPKMFGETKLLPEEQKLLKAA